MNQKLKLGLAALGGAVLASGLGAGIAYAGMNSELGPFGRADVDGNGQLTKTEWVKAAGDRFDRLDVNKDGKLVWSELPRRMRHGDGHGFRHGPDGPGGPGRGFEARDPDDRPAPPPAQPAAPVQNTN
ncbi:hypothetical protein ACFQ1E_17040 [Sphingomonas canadensis]|uniref:EF-hand domain-containing protein n=1 Tax=Sphingomonas canadensis TaxID=1219257 RepID=A0ABW3HEW0_9SPHN|nr:hypothetical protein [Sphingomonas canadensis]MCW3837753.1 hypothetical protein [Sphingomonas canadensis]